MLSFGIAPFGAKGAIVVACACLMGSCLMASGCNQGARSLPLDKATGKQALTEFLTLWKDGKSVGEFTVTHPKAAAADPEWEAGAKLVNFTIGNESDDGTNLHIAVDLVLRGADGAESTQKITYIVGTSPVLSIFRK